MKKELITHLHKNFEGCAHEQDGVEYWNARDLQQLLGYSTWRRFEEVIDRAKIACKNAGQSIEDHFADAGKMVDIGSGASRPINDLSLTRYACYLIAQNGDPRKDEIAFAMTYFAVQTRKQEIIEQRIAEQERLQARDKLTLSQKELAGVLYERSIDGQGFARILSKGDAALFGGYTTQDIEEEDGRAGQPATGRLPSNHHHQSQGLRQRSHQPSGQAAGSAPRVRHRPRAREEQPRCPRDPDQPEYPPRGAAARRGCEEG